MSYARQSTLRGTGLRGFPTQELRGFPTQELRGLGQLSPEQQVQISALSAQVKRGLDELVLSARAQTAAIVKSYKGSFARAARFFLDELLPGKTIGHTPADEWASHIVGYAENVRSILTKTTQSGQLFFVEKPQDAVRLVELAQKDLKAMVKELQSEVAGLTLESTLVRITDTVLGTLVKIVDVTVKSAAKAVFRFPVGSIAIVSVAAVAIAVFYRKAKRTVGTTA